MMNSVAASDAALMPTRVIVSAPTVITALPATVLRWLANRSAKLVIAATADRSMASLAAATSKSVIRSRPQPV